MGEVLAALAGEGVGRRLSWVQSDPAGVANLLQGFQSLTLCPSHMAAVRAMFGSQDQPSWGAAHACGSPASAQAQTGPSLTEPGIPPCAQGTPAAA